MIKLSTTSKTQAKEVQPTPEKKAPVKTSGSKITPQETSAVTQTVESVAAQNNLAKTSVAILDVTTTQHQLPPALLLKQSEMERVTVGLKHTINLGNYESYQIYVERSAVSDADTVDTCFEDVLKWVEKRVERLGEEVTQS